MSEKVNPTDDSVSLRQYFEQMLSVERDAVKTLKGTIDEFQKMHDKAHEREHEMTAEAITKAEQSLSKQLEAITSNLDQLTRSQGHYITKETFLRSEDTVNRRFDTVETALEMQANLWANLQGRMAMFGVILGAISLVSMFLALWTRLS